MNKKCYKHPKRGARFITRPDKDHPTIFLCSECASETFFNHEGICSYDNTQGKEREV